MTYVSCTKDLQVSLLADRISQCIDSWTPPAIRGRDGHCGSRKTCCGKSESHCNGIELKHTKLAGP